ncbi:hypothetical protein JB92DRAFT_2917724 [Gautieria morchelliformis]|nr:hypothetical protein JB92DRAFT_2917724 [Gautieria morchelliformis]
MGRSATSSPIRKKSRLSSPTYDDHFDEFDDYDFQALDKIETSFSHSFVATPVRSSQSDPFCPREKRSRGVEDTAQLKQHDDSGVVLVDSKGTRKSTTTPPPPPCATQSRPPLSHTLGFKSAAHLPLDVPKRHISNTAPKPASANFLPVSLIISADSINGNVGYPPPPGEPLDHDHTTWFAPADTASALAHTFTSASAHRSKLTLVSPSVAALEQAKKRMQMWEAEIETELSALEHAQEIVPGTHDGNKEPYINREPLKGVENSFASPSMSGNPSPASLPDINPHSTSTPIRPFKAPSFTTPRSNSNAPNLSRPFGVRLASVVSRSSAAAEVTPSDSSLAAPSTLPPVTPIRPASFNGRPQPQTPKLPTLPRPSDLSQYQTTTPHKTKPLGLSPRAHAFTSSRARPKFVTPFKSGMKPSDRKVQLTPSTPTIQPQFDYKGKGPQGLSSITEASKKNRGQGPEYMTHSNRTVLAKSRLVPHHAYGHEELKEMGLDLRLFSLTTVSHFLYYRFNTTGPDANPFSTQMSLGSDSALEALLAMDCRLATKGWVDNHWSLILWKMLGMACLEPAKAANRWCWSEVMRQLRYRYQREQEGGSRPAVRLIVAHDAPSSAPLVLCVSNIFWTDESVDADGRLVPAHPELEVTDGWYRLRATVDEALARAARNKVLRIGRKIACSGAKLDSSKKDPMEVLDAYGSVQLILSGNSTHLAPWHAKLGFQNTPFVATLRSLTSDGGVVSLVDVIITKTFSVGFLEFITTENGETIREGPRTEKDEAIEEDSWNERRSNQAAKLQDRLEKKLLQLESYADRLESIAGSNFRPTEDESPPNNIEDLVDELDDSDDPAHIIKGINKADAGWLSLLLRKKCQTDREKSRDLIDRELASSFPPRQVRNFRVLNVKDAQTVRKPSWRTAQVTVWDVMSLNVTEGGAPGSFNVGERYMISSLVPSQQSAWMGHEPGSEIYFCTRRDSKWKLVSRP